MLDRLRRLPLWAIFLLSLAGCWLLRVWFPLYLHYASAPLPDVRRLSPTLAAGLAYGAVLCALFGLHALAHERVRQRLPHRPLVTILLGALLLAQPLITTFPINATDLYRYVIRGRVSSIYGHNPYETPPDAFPDDPYLPLAGEWAGETTPYGPLWELLAAAVTGAAPGNLWLNLLSFKIILTLAFLLTGALLWWTLAADPDRPERATNAGRLLLWAWNPALLLIFVVDGHNDALMLFWLVLGWYLVRRRWPTLGFLTATLAALTKPIALLALPFLFVAAWRSAARVNSGALSFRVARFTPLLYHSQIWFAMGAIAGSALLTTLAFLPFGSPLELIGRLLREATEFAGFSPATLLILLTQRLEWSITTTQISLVMTGLFGLAALWLGWLALCGRSAWRGVADIFTVYVWQALAFRIWYAAWPLVGALLDDDSRAGRRRRRASLWFLFTTQLSVIIYGHMWQFLLGRDFLWSHLIGVPFAFGLPWLLAGWQTRREERL